MFVYSGSRLIAEYSTETPPSNPTTSWTVTDQLGSPRVIVNTLGEVVSRRDFMPFGEELGADGTYRTTVQKYGQTDSVRQKFTGYQKDEETGLDFAQARMYQNLSGRFTAIDPLLASGKSVNPQTFNRYVYVMNSPLILNDPSGMQAGTLPKGERQKVFVFLFAVENDRESKKLWRQVSREAKRAGNTDLKIYRGPNASMENYLTALDTENSTVISTGHSTGDNKLSKETVTGNRFAGNGIQDANGDTFTTNGITKDGETYDASALEIKSSKVMINSCNIDSFVPVIKDRMKAGSELKGSSKPVQKTLSFSF